MTIAHTLQQRRDELGQALVIVGAVLFSIVLCWLALQRPARFALDIGGDLQRSVAGDVSAPVYDAPYLANVHEPEPATLDATTSETYRWSYPQASIAAPGLSGGPLLAALRVAPPPGQPPTLRLAINRQPLTAALSLAPRTLHLLAPATPNGALTLDLDAPAYQPPNDARELGVRLDRLTVTPLAVRIYLPWRLLGAFGATLALLAAGARLSGLGARTAAAIALAAGVTLALALSLERTTLTIFALPLLAVSAAAFALLALGRIVGGWATRRTDITARETALAAGLTALAFGLRLAGLRHPQANYSDLQLHVHNLEGVTDGMVFFAEGLPCRAGGGRSPYPPGSYLALLPLQLVTSDSSAHQLLVQAGNSVLDSLTVPLLWITLRLAAGAGSPVPLLAAALYLLPLPMLRAMNIGEFANVGGQALALPAVLGLSLWLGCGRPAGWRPLLLVALTIAALGHSGVLISVGLWGACCWLILLAQRRWQAAWQLAWLGGAALIVAGALFYSAFLGDPTLAGTDPNCPIPTPLTAKLSAVAQSVLSLGSVTPPWLLLLGLIGVALAPRRLPALALALQAWFLGALLSQVSLLWSEQTVRWQHFLYPALCIGAAIALAALADRARWGRWAAAALLGLTLGAALIFWIVQIVSYRTGLFV